VGAAVGRVELVKAFRLLFALSALALSGNDIYAASGDAVPMPAAKPDTLTTSKPAQQKPEDRKASEKKAADKKAAEKKAADKKAAEHKPEQKSAAKKGAAPLALNRPPRTDPRPRAQLPTLPFASTLHPAKFRGGLCPSRH
jgi:hypothetical protein